MKVALFGFGHMNKISIKNATEQGYEVVAVIGHHNVGEDAGVVAGIDAINVPITHSSQAKEVLMATKPQVCIVATRSLLDDVSSTLLLLAECRINAVTICEEAFYSWNTNTEMTTKIDKAFRDNAVTCSASGAQDVYWGYLPSLMLGITHKVEQMNFDVSFNVSDYGIALLQAVGCGLTAEEFNEKYVTNEKAVPSYVWNSNEWLCGAMKWKIISTTQQYKPCIATVDIETPMGLMKAGTIVGSEAIVTTVAETFKGNTVTIIASQTAKAYRPDEEDKNNWVIKGEPNLEIQCKKPDTVGITVASAVNRLQSLVDARAGYVPSFELEAPKNNF